jgi:membrane fusion protein (multidrug efflux system)
MGVEQTRRRIAIDIERTKASVQKAKGELSADQSRLRRLEKDYERIAALKEQGAESQSSLDRITGDRDYALGLYNAGLGVVEVAESNHEKALNEMEGIRVREQRLGVLEGQVTMAKARVTAAEVELDSSVVRAEASGRVVERIVEVGGSAKVGEPMMSMWTGQPWVEAWANERDLRKFRVGSIVEVAMAASPQRKLSGRVEAIGLVADRALQPNQVPSTLHSYVRPNAWVPVRVALDEQHPAVQLGLSVIVGIRKDGGAEGQGDARSLARLPVAAPIR